MKLSIVAVAAVFALSGPAFAQIGTSDGLNGATLGQSQPGVNAGVPYHDTAPADPTPEAADNPPAATDRTTPVARGSVKQQSAATPKHRKDSGMQAGSKKTPAPPGASAQATAKLAPPSPGASSPH
jgi:hypothetical protein